MSFGFSIGDFVTVSKLIKDISSCLQDVGGAKEDYQELLRELQCLEQALRHLDKLYTTGRNPANLDSIKFAALSCRRPLEQFLHKIKKYDKSLGVWGKTRVIKRVADKMRWGLGQKEEVRKIQSYLNIHIGTINMLLAEHGLEKLDLASETAETQHVHVQESLMSTRSMIGDLTARLQPQIAVVNTTQTMLAQLFGLINGEFRTSWKSFGEMVAKVCVATQQSYTILLEIRSSLTGPDARMTWFQAPLNIEDALGRKYQICSVNFTFKMLDAAIKARFSTGPGSIEVRIGNYEYFKTKNSYEVLSDKSPLLPGTEITMAVIVVLQTSTSEACPMPKCGSANTSECSGGGRTCRECGVWFSPTKKRRRSVQDNFASPTTKRLRSFIRSESVSSISDSSDTESEVDNTELVEEFQDSYKNVRLSSIIRTYPCPYCHLRITTRRFASHSRVCRTRERRETRQTKVQESRAKVVRDSKLKLPRDQGVTPLASIIDRDFGDISAIDIADGRLPLSPGFQTRSPEYSGFSGKTSFGIHPSMLDIDYRRDAANRRLTLYPRARFVDTH